MKRLGIHTKEIIDEEESEDPYGEKSRLELEVPVMVEVNQENLMFP